MNDQITTLPGVVTIDLNTVERDPKDIKPPFRVQVGEQIIEMSDPEEVDWRDLLTMQDPSEFLRLTMSEADRKYLREQAIPAWRFSKLMEAYYAHYDLEEKMREARRRESVGSAL